MPIYATSEAEKFWQKCNKPARSLAASKLICMAKDKQDKTWRQSSCDAIESGSSLAKKTDSFMAFTDLLQDSDSALISAKLESHLIINSAGGVLENGGICLDRISGVPYIPGSAIKGAARRYAIHLLGETKDPTEKATLLANICQIFGYGDTEWRPGRHKEKNHVHSDFWLAMVPLYDTGKKHDKTRNDLWKTVSEKAAETLIKSHDWIVDSKKPLLKQLPNLSGSICFLPAFPEKDLDVEIDILTCLHQDYYDPKQAKSIATDDEDPNPVLFPTVPKGTSFRFSLLPNGSRAGKDDLSHAKTWLSEALQIFGLGGKTNVGYGWFSIDENSSYARSTKLLSPKEETYTFKCITPCFCAGADQSKRELRSSSIRGALRWWFRALGGNSALENETFGGVNSATESSFQIRIIDVQPSEDQPLPILKTGEPLSYILYYPSIAVENTRWNKQACYPVGSTFKIQIRKFKMLSKDSQQKLDEALQAFRHFGSLGMHITRGLGAVQDKDVTPISFSEANSMLAEHGFSTKKWEASHTCWQDVLKEAGEWLKDMRKDGFKAASPSPLGSSSPRQTSAVYLRPMENGTSLTLTAFEAPHERVLSEKSKTTLERHLLTADELTILLAAEFEFKDIAPNGKFHNAADKWDQDNNTEQLSRFFKETKAPKFAGLITQNWYQALLQKHQPET